MTWQTILKREKSIITKADGDIYALFMLGAQAELVSSQNAIIEAIPDLEAIAPEDFHITAVFGNGVDPLPIMEWLQYEQQAFAIVVDGIDSFQVDGGYAIYLRVRHEYRMEDLRSYMLDLLTRSGMGMISVHSLPYQFTAHITMGYSQNPVVPASFSPFAVLVNGVRLGDGDHIPLMEVDFKSVEGDMKTKAIQLEVMVKGIHLTDEGDLVIPIIGVPFKGPVKGKADLAGDFFHKDTDIGFSREVDAYWDHGRDGNYNAVELKSLGFDDDQIKGLMDNDFGFGEKAIGVAQRDDTTEDGIIYNIIVSRRAKYLKALERAAKEGKISASGEYKAFRYDPSVKGKVDHAPLVGMALTPSPYNIEARIQKGLEIEMAAKKPVVDEKKPAAEEKTAEDNIDAVPPVKTSIADAVKAKAAEMKAASEEAVEDEEEESTEEGEITLKSLYAQVVALTAELKALRESDEESPTFKAVEDFREEMKDALPVLGEMMANAVINHFETRGKSLPEFTADDIFQRQNGSEDQPAKSVAPARRVASTEQRGSKIQKPLHDKAMAMQNYPGSN